MAGDEAAARVTTVTPHSPPRVHGDEDVARRHQGDVSACDIDLLRAKSAVKPPVLGQSGQVRLLLGALMAI
jgi:hypothetical protein